MTSIKSPDISVTEKDNNIKHHFKINSSEALDSERGMLLKVYSGLVLAADALLVLLRVLLAILEALFSKFLPAKEKSVAGEIALITGTGHGIGRELAHQLGALGATLVCWDVNQEWNEKTAAELRKKGYKVHAYKCDVSNREEVLNLAKKVQAEVGDVSIIINNAGIMPCRPFSTYTPEVIRRIFDVNVFAHFWILEAFLPRMISNNHGHVVGLSSMAGVMGITNLVPYCASKYAVRGMMEALSEELRENLKNSQIHFTTIFPFIVDTGLCQKPRTRFPSLLAIVQIPKAASEIIKAMRRNYNEYSIPNGLLDLNHFLRLLPLKATNTIKDFVDSGVGAHDE
ncbi:epidermal retinol dehydrogenase 2-like isoform X2 [Schistocerca piceifrons]|uniref:epidermal retinol dehydrogenase 2-like isoform X2 n=1 Tax=Schistocerca piceifrons TaxID=274613 RepID=UPI001F5F3C0A|nr:epidermal retinol dehydrogenase 2-like isoform X2 [Schistocerca piceifrons]